MTSQAASFDSAALAAEIARRVGVRVEQGASLARLTTMRVGGPADLLATVHNSFEFRGLVRFARARGLPLLVLGRGSNVVVSDRGVRGLVIHVKAEQTRIDGVRYVAAAGVPMARAATETQRAGLTGLEFGLAIPGTVGGAIWANAGAHGAEVASVLEAAEVLDPDGVESHVAAAALGFGYRDSRLKHPADENRHEFVVGGTFALTPAAPEAIRATLDEIRRWRQAHQPLGLPSAGSVFRNPAEGPSAGERIEAAGLKGRGFGGAMISEKHANFIIAGKSATAADVRGLADLVRATIRTRDNVDLAFEIEFVGDWTGWPWSAGEPGETLPA